MSKRKILVTGGAGFIFSNFARYVLKNSSDYNIISIDKFSHKSLNSVYRNKSHMVHIGDVSYSHFVDMVFTLEQPDYVIHAADSKNLVNILSTQVIADACVRHKIKKLIYVSSNTVYGSSGLEFNEKSVLDPVDMHAVTKASSEMLLSVINGLNYDIVRLCNNYGPKQPVTSFIPSIIKNIYENNEVVLSHDGMMLNDWIHVQDTCSAILTILNADSANEIYNISAKQECHDIEICQDICNMMEKGHDLIKFTSTNNSYKISLNNDKIRSLGWKPVFKIRDGLAHTVNWYLNNLYFIR